MSGVPEASPVPVAGRGGQGCPYPDCGGELTSRRHPKNYRQCKTCGRRPEYAPDDPLTP